MLATCLARQSKVCAGVSRRVFEKLLASDPRETAAVEGYLRCKLREGDETAVVAL